MRISLIGMSGTGKSHWSEKLAGLGFRRYSCDEIITERLASDLSGPDGTRLELGPWMGFPFEPGYEDREKLYLSCEMEVVSEILDWLETHPPDSGNVVVDTTGSVIYTGKRLLARLRSLTTVVNFTSPPQAREIMLREYVANPRPILWRGLFAREAGEDVQGALKRSYHRLLDARERLYHELADVEIDYFTRRSPDFTVSDLIAAAAGK